LRNPFGAGGRKLLGGDAGSDPNAPITRTDTQRRLSLLNDFEDSGLGWFWATDSEGHLIYLSDNAAEQLGKSAASMMGESLPSLFILNRRSDDEDSERPLAFLLSARNSIADLPVRLAVEDKEVWWSITAKPQFDARGQFQGYRGSARDITASYERQKDASRLSQYDSLTGLANRHRMTKRLDAVLTAYKVAKRSCALMMLDLDRFKHVNDTLGHPAGDDLLKQVSQRLQRVIGKQGEIGRLGGDEFQVIIPDVDDRGKLADLALRIIQMVSQPYSIEGSRAIIGTSVGIAVAPYDGLDFNDLVKSADLALYAAKGGGRGQHRFYSSELKDSADERRSIEENLRDALAKGELELHYQPVVRTADNRVSGFEALMRWNHPVRGPISPGLFIPIAEESNLINQLGEWALRQACADAARWPGNLRVAVNVSAPQFSTDGLLSVVANALANSGLKPEQLELEITESVFMGDSDAVDVKFKALKKLGVRLALDDFGTGYSSLSYLRKAPFDKIKIDQSFVRGCTEEDNSNSAIIAAIVSLADALDMETTAEGVEALDQLDHIKMRGATHVQGWVFSAAMPNEAVVERLEKGELQFHPVGPKRHRSERRTVYRRIGIIHEDFRYNAVLRNLSKTGALIEGLDGVPKGTEIVVDLGDGQLAVATVRRSRDSRLGVEFEESLIGDGADGLVTRHRVSPYALAAAGMPLAALPSGAFALPGLVQAAASLQPRFREVEVSRTTRKAA
jgi:diguanylate cyclase (GGDEF)-like protein/PAS domain S-box-containing protein